MHSYRVYDLTLHSDFELCDLPPSHLEADVEIRRAAFEVPTLESTSIGRLGINALFGGGVDAATIHWPGVATMQALGGRLLKVTPDGRDLEPDVLSMYITSEALGLILYQRNLFLLHGSAVAINGKAVAFVGPPGAGKSTLAAACARRGHPVLCDDMVAIDLRRQAGGPLVIPGDARIKAWPDTIEALGLNPEMFAPAAPNSAKRKMPQSAREALKPTPLHKIVVLERSDECVFAPCNPVSAIVGLTRYFPCPSAILQGTGQRRRLKDCELLCSHTPIWSLKRTHDFSALQASIDHFEQE